MTRGADEPTRGAKGPSQVPEPIEKPTPEPIAGVAGASDHRGRAQEDVPTMKRDKRLATVDVEAPTQGRFADAADAPFGLAFDRFPDGVALVDRSHVIVSSNRAFRAMLGDPPRASGRATTCCELLCRHVDAAFGTVCITERMFSGHDPIRDLRLDVAGAERGMLLSGARVGSDGTHGVIGLQRTRGTGHEHLSGRTSLHMQTLGRTAVEGPARVLDGNWLDQRPGQLLRFLIVQRGRFVSVEAIAEALWADARYGTSNSVRHLVHVLRNRVEPTRQPGVPSRFIVSHAGGYGLDMRFVTVDADVFTDSARAALAASAAGPLDAEQRLDEALALYTGDFLTEEPFAGWAHTERERLLGLAEALLRELSDSALARHDIGAASAHLARLAEMEPFDSDVHRQLIALALCEGRRGRALRHYNAFQLRLERAFGEPVDFTLADVSGEDPFSLAPDVRRYR
jgi:DNA-binding SARP family transcriptional activator